MIKFQCIYFDKLSLKTLHDIFVLRQDVFTVEQNCAYQDADGKDLYAHHVVGRDKDGEVVAYARILPKGISYDNYVAIGRVVTSKKVRGTGAGIELMTYAVNQTRKIYGDSPIKISAQSHLEKFYNKFGFLHTGEEYMEDGIPHIGMTIE